MLTRRVCYRICRRISTPYKTCLFRIGFGRYQVQLFLLTGLGWMADSMHFPSNIEAQTHVRSFRLDIWLQGVAVVLPQVQQELLPVRVEFATLSLYVGLILGAATWGVMADLIGRKLSFNVRHVFWNVPDAIYNCLV